MKIRCFIDDLQWFFKEDFFKPLDFFWISWKAVRKGIKEMPLKTCLAVVYLIIFGTLFMTLYYLTLPFRLLSLLCETWCESF